MKKILCLTAMMMILVWVSTAYAESEYTGYQITLVGGQYKIKAPGKSPVNSITRKLILGNGDSEVIDFANATTAGIDARNTATPIGLTQKATVSAGIGGTTPPMTFACSADGGNGWIIEIGDGAGGNTDAILNINVECAIPTLSEWGLIIFSLLILTLATVVIVRRKTTLATAGGDASVTIGAPLFVPVVFWKTLTVMLVLAGAGLGVAMAIAGTVPLRDTAGTIVSAGIVAYIAHLWIGARKE